MKGDTQFECLIIGGGLIGMLTARELRQAGMTNITLVERGETGRESSWAGGGILSPLYPWRYPEAVSALASWSQDHYPELAVKLQQESGIDPEYRRNGLLVLDAEERDLALGWAERWQRRLELVDKRKVRQLEPALGMSPEQALWLPEVGQVRNPRLAQAVRASIQNQGVRIIEQQPVTGLILRNDHIHGVRTDRGELSAERVVVAGGAWSALLLESTGLQLPVRPVRGQMILYRAEPELVRRIILSQDRYVIPRRDGRVLVGSTLEEAGFEKVTTSAALRELEAETRRLVPVLADYPVEHHWAGLRPGSPRGIPYICEHPRIRNLFINTGHFRNGVVLAPASVRLLADLMLERPPLVDPAPYAFEA
jgi:glycine oxidase